MVDEGPYRNPSLAVDALALRDGPRGSQVLLITRRFPPWEGRLAFPGGFVEMGEDPENAVLRELIEETGVEGSNPELFAVRGSPNRDPESISSPFSIWLELIRMPFLRLEMMLVMLNG